MKNTLLIISSFFFLTGFSQSERKIFYPNKVECYFDNDSGKSLEVYDNFNGSLIQSFKIEEYHYKNQWFKVVIKEYRDEWFMVENIMVAPQKNDSLNLILGALTGKWIRAENLKIHLSVNYVPDSLAIPFYRKPDINSSVVCKSSNFLVLSLIETKGLWAKVTFIHKDIKQTGWIERENQCAYPWTSCP